MIPWRELFGDIREYDFLTFNELYTIEELADAIQDARAKAPKNPKKTNIKNSKKK